MTDTTAVPFTIRCITPSRPDGKSAWLGLELRIHGQTLHLDVSDARFQNSPNELQKFREYQSVISHHAYDERDEQLYGHGDPFGMGLLTKCCAWALTPVVPMLDSLAPELQPKSTMTLADYFAGSEHYCQIGAIDGLLVLHSIQSVNSDDRLWPSAGEHAFTIPSDTFSGFPPAKVEIIHDGTPSLDNTPTTVQVNGCQYRFDMYERNVSHIACEDMSNYTKIASAQFPPTVHVYPLMGIVLDEEKPHRPLGLLFPSITDATSLVDLHNELQSTLAMRQMWVQQLQDSVAALHAAGIVWYGANKENVFVDKHMDLWIGGINRGNTTDLVDSDAEVTMSSDQQGVESLSRWILDGDGRHILSKI